MTFLFQTKMAENDPTFYLGNYLKSISGLPEDLKKNFTKMLTLDQKNKDLTNSINSASQEYLRKVREKHLNPRKRKSDMEKIMKMYNEAKENTDVKVEMAVQTYEMVDRHIRKLDADLARFEAEMKEAGGKLSQTESEGEEETDVKKKQKKKKKGQKEERPKTPLAPVSNLNLSNTDVPIVDMPVDPNEPTYCLCQQVSYGEMIGCDNQDCPIEWFHFPCMGLQTKPKGKWYCPKCLPMFKKQK